MIFFILKRILSSVKLINFFKNPQFSALKRKTDVFMI